MRLRTSGGCSLVATLIALGFVGSAAAQVGSQPPPTPPVVSQPQPDPAPIPTPKPDPAPRAQPPPAPPPPPPPPVARTPPPPAPPTLSVAPAAVEPPSPPRVTPPPLPQTVVPPKQTVPNAAPKAASRTKPAPRRTPPVANVSKATSPEKISDAPNTQAAALPSTSEGDSSALPVASAIVGLMFSIAFLFIAVASVPGGWLVHAPGVLLRVARVRRALAVTGVAVLIEIGIAYVVIVLLRSP